MSSNVGLSTPRGSGTSGYVQRNSAFLKPRNAGYGAPYPPVSSSAADHNNNGQPSGFRQRKPDQQILEHDRKRAIELQVLEERERLEEENEELEKSKKTALTDEEIDEKCDALRERLLKELEEGGPKGRGGREDYDARRRAGGGRQDKRQLKSYQVHELAEAKIQESERLRKALGIKEDWEQDPATSSFSKNKEKSEEKQGKDRADDERDRDYSSGEDDRRSDSRRRHS
jgi:cwf21 domain